MEKIKDMSAIELLQGDKWLRHPLHPALVALPIGAWVTSLVMDAVATATRSECAQEAADRAINVGLVGAGASAAAGISEFLRVPNEQPTINQAVTHGAMNIGATALFAINSALRSSRRGRGRPGGFLPKLMSLAGVAAITYTGWLGGQMAYNGAVGVDTKRGEELARQQEEKSARRREREAEEIAQSI